ncbi:MAG: hypothetical protein ACLFWF_05855 [Alphaproteobacteria bacterium]
MSEKPEEPGDRSGLNPSLKDRRDRTYDTTKTSRAPAETASVKRGGAWLWPLIWAVVTVLGVIITLWLVIDF